MSKMKVKNKTACKTSSDMVTSREEEMEKTKKLVDESSIAPKCYLTDDAKKIDDHAANGRAIKKALGTRDDDAMTLMLVQLKSTLPSWSADDEGIFNGALAMLHEIAPRNQMEGMLAVQMIACHNMAMEATQRAMAPNQSPEFVSENFSRAQRLMKTFVAQTDALSKLRGDQRTVTIKHVNVNAGAQAVVGDVHHHGDSNSEK